MKDDDNMKFHVKEQSGKIFYPETMNLKPLSKSIKTKGTPKKVKSTESESSTKRSPSYFKHVDSHFLDSPTPKSQKIFSRVLRLENHFPLTTITKNHPH